MKKIAYVGIDYHLPVEFFILGGNESGSAINLEQSL